MSRQIRVGRPPKGLDRDLYKYLQQVADALNALPQQSALSEALAVDNALGILEAPPAVPTSHSSYGQLYFENAILKMVSSGGTVISIATFV